MTREGAEAAITGSALVVGGIYVFRRLSETDVQLTNAHGLRLKQLAGFGTPAPVGTFVVGWGFTFLVLSLVAQASPELGGTFAVLVATGAVLANGQSVSSDVSSKLAGGGSAATQPSKAGAVTATPSSGAAAPAPTYSTVPQGWVRRQG